MARCTLSIMLSFLSKVKTNTKQVINMHPAFGIVGIIIFAIGGTFLAETLYLQAIQGVTPIVFFSFLFIGAGLWVIALCARP